MSLQAHIVELERKHAALEKELKAASAHTSLGDLEVRELKRQKLLLKDQISRLAKTADGDVIH